MSTAAWRELAEGVFVMPCEQWQLNIGLVVGGERCLVVDTGSDAAFGREIRDAVRSVTDKRCEIVNTHAHYDHWYGNVAFGPAAMWAQEGFWSFVDRNDARERTDVVRALRTVGYDDLAGRIDETPQYLPDHGVGGRAWIDLGGRGVHLVHAGRGHTDHDLVVGVPDQGVVFWGDLVEAGDDPQFDDAYPREWGLTVSRLLDTVEIGLARTMVPGHGAVLGRDNVEEQCDQLQRLAWWLGESIDQGQRDPDAVLDRVRATGFQEATLRMAVDRALTV